MNNKLDRFLLATLWMAVILLTACFWFNTIFAFNLFRSAHWRYLAYMQASQISVSPMFYISLIVFTVIMVSGLYYILLRPRWRRIRFAKQSHKDDAASPHVNKDTAPQPASQTESVLEIAANGNTQSAPFTPSHNDTAQSTPLPRPPRLNLNIGQMTTNRYPAATGGGMTSASPTTHTPQGDMSANATTTSTIRTIFESAGYVSKGTPRIRDIQTAIIAIAPGEILWIGAIGVGIRQMNNAISTIRNIFTDTLEDIEIHINAFIINATNDGDDAADNGILLFNSTNELHDYIIGHPAATIDDDNDEQSEFDAYSSYITTVVEYIGKI